MKSKLLKRGFVSLIATQFLGAANDNVLKQVLIFMVMANGLWKDLLGDGGQGLIGLGLTLPFILLSGYAGQISDRFSKRTVAVGAKVAEIPIVALAGIGLWTASFGLTFTAFVLLAAQSAFFGPAKYGMIPELVNEGDLSRANGAINMFTNIAIILGTLIAGPVSGRFFPKPDPTGFVAERVVWLPLVVMLAIAIAGLLASLPLPKLQSKAPSLRYDLNPVGTYWWAMKEMSRGPLLAIALAWAGFYLIGMIAILILPEYENLLGVSFTHASFLFAFLAISLGLGSGLAGLISGHRIEPRLVTAGAVGLTLSLALLGIIKSTFWSVAALISAAGLFAGAYLVPLQAMIQDLAPDSERGRFLGATNALSFVFMSLGGVLVIVGRGPLDISANRMFLVCAGISAAGTIALFAFLRRTLLDAAAQCNQG